MKASSAFAKPYSMALTGFSGKQISLMTKVCKLSLKKSAQSDPPCPS